MNFKDYKFILIRYILFVLTLILIIIGILGVKIAIPIAIILLGITCILKSFPILQSGNKKLVIFSIICGLLIILCGVKSIFMMY